ncbi:MAG: LysR family transcriptional regulator [Burkholderiales bacterium]
MLADKDVPQLSRNIIAGDATVPDLNDMMVFASVVAANGFAESARQLGISKSRVSKSVARLERALSVRLLNRSTRGMSLTEIGAAYYKHCVHIADEAAQAAAVVGELRSEPVGVLKITCPVAFGRLHIAPAVAGYLARYPKLRVDLTTTDRLVDLTGEGFDVAIRIEREPDLHLVARKLAAARRVICATPGYFARFGVPTTPQDLMRHNCLHYTHFGSHGQWRLQGANGQIVVPVDGSLRVNDDDVLCGAVLGGLGIALLPTFIIGNELQTGLLQSVLPEFVPLERYIYAVHLPNPNLPIKVRGFIEFLQAQIGPVPYWDVATELAMSLAANAPI